MEYFWGPDPDGSGVGVRQLDTDRGIQAGPLNVFAYLGLFEEGESGEIRFCDRDVDLAEKIGQRHESDWAPHAAYDLFRVGGGARFYGIPVRDGTEKKASWKVYARSPRTRLVGTLTAKSPGRSSGRKIAVGGVWTTTATDLTETTLKITLGEPWTSRGGIKTDEFKGGTLYLDGISSTTYEIISNTSSTHPTTPAVVTVRSGSTMKTTYGAGSDKGFRIVLPSNGRELSISFDNARSGDTSRFALTVYRDGQAKRVWDELTFDANDRRYWVTVLSSDRANNWLVATDNLTPDAPTADLRPANYFGRLASLTSLTAEVEVFSTVMDAASGATPTVTIGTTNDLMQYRDRIVITMSSTTAGTAVSDRFGTIGTVTLAGGPPLTGTLTSTTPFLPDITITNHATLTLAAADKIILHYHPLPVSGLANAAAVPDADQSPLQRYRIDSNDHKSFTLISGDMLTAGALGAGTIATTTTTLTGTGTAFTTALAAGDFVVDVANKVARKVASVGGATAAVLSSAFPSNVTAGSTYRIIKRWMVVAPVALENGYDGWAGVADANFTALLDPSSSPLKRVRAQNPVLVKLATPGRASAAVITAAKTMQVAYNWMYRIEVPADIEDSGALAAWYDEVGAVTDFPVVACLPSWGYMPDPLKPGLEVLQPLTGVIQGVEASIARLYKGYHEPASGEIAQLVELVRPPTDAMFEIDDAAMGRLNTQYIRWRRGIAHIWGNRNLTTNPKWAQKNHRELMSYYQCVMFGSFDWIVQRLGNPGRLAQVRQALRAFFQVEYDKGAVTGSSLDDAVIIDVSANNNSEADLAAHNGFADVKPRLANALERFEFRTDRQGVSER